MKTPLPRFFVLLLLIPLASGANEYRKVYSLVCQNPIIVYITAVACVLLFLVLLELIYCVPVNECKRAQKTTKKERKDNGHIEMQTLSSNTI